MPRKVFISFLGNGFYEPTKYVENTTDEVKVESLRFIQEATINAYCKDYNNNDIIYIFTTKGALLNWNDGEHKNFRTNSNEWYEGLGSRLKGLKLDCSSENIMIPEGQSTDEIWEIFRIVYEKLQEGDELIFDITHGFRSLPMLNMVLINYAKLLKNITVKGIYYGAFDAKYLRNGRYYSPIWNLKDFEELQEWTNNANIFLKTGNAIPLTSQMFDDIFNNLKQQLSNFSKYILVNRGMDIYEGNTMINLHEELSKGIGNFPKKYEPLKPILKKIENEFEGYKSENATNGFLAVRWCIQNGLIQQAATLLEEFIVTFVMIEIGESNSLKNHSKRMTISSALTIGDAKPFEFIVIPAPSEKITLKIIAEKLELLNWQQIIVPQVRDLLYKKKVNKLLSDIKESVRNDVNHAGFREKINDFDSLESSIKKRYNETRKLIKKLKEIDLPEL